MSLFTSKRERKLWIWLLVVVLAIFTTIGLSGTIAYPVDPRLLNHIFFWVFISMVAALFGFAIQKKFSRMELWMLVAIVAVYIMVFLRMGTNAAERTHIFEYSVVSLIMYLILKERETHGKRIGSPALLAILITALIGFLDETIQFFFPKRVFDMIDVGFNAFAGLLGVSAKVSLDWIGRKIRNKGN